MGRSSCQAQYSQHRAQTKRELLGAGWQPGTWAPPGSWKSWGSPSSPVSRCLWGWGAATNGLGEEGSAGPRPNTAPCSLDRQPQKAFTLKSMGQGWARCTLSWDYPWPVPGFENIPCPRASPAPWCPCCSAYHGSSGLHSPQPSNLLLQW